MACKLSREQIERTTAFHGHWCPGLATGIRAAEWALANLGRAADEEVVAVVETDMCAVDAIQSLCGCTYGKGNLIHLDYGKNAFSFYRRRDGRAARLVSRPDLFPDIRGAQGELNRKRQAGGLSAEEEKRFRDLRAELSERIMGADFEELFAIGEPAVPMPATARILDSRLCDACGEAVMETRTRQKQGKTYCIPCFEKLFAPTKDTKPAKETQQNQ
jgi:formylmethanofuran dehydrogenase subunit E